MRLVENCGYVPTSFRTLPACRAHRVSTVEDAVAAMSGSVAPCVIAGGTDLPARWNEGVLPSDLIDVGALDALRGIATTDEGLRIGALTTHAQGASNALVNAYSTSFAHAWLAIANVRVRFSATIGGNLMARRTRYEGSILLSALGAVARLHGSSGSFDLPVEALWDSDVATRALLVAIILPHRERLRFDYERGLRPIMTQAVARDASGWGRVVTATEYAQPVVRALNASGEPDGALVLSDPVTSTPYLQRVSDVFLQRQRARLAA